jgi:hypothetical protein
MSGDIERSEFYRIDGLWFGADQALRYLRTLGFSWSESRAYLAALDKDDKDRRTYYAARASRGLRVAALDREEV